MISCGMELGGTPLYLNCPGSRPQDETYDAVQLMKNFHEPKVATARLGRESSCDWPTSNFAKVRTGDAKRAICRSQHSMSALWEVL